MKFRPFFLCAIAVIVPCLPWSPAVWCERARGDSPLYEKIAFDRIRLVEEHGSGVFDIFPIAFPGGRKPAALPKTGTLTVRFVERPGEEYEIPWSAIASVDVFDDLVLKELHERQTDLLRDIAALSVQKSDEPGEADKTGETGTPPYPLRDALEFVYGYYDYFFKKSFRTPAVAESYHRFLAGETNYYFKCRDWTNALARLQRLTTEAPNTPKLDEMWGRVFEDLLRELTEKENYRNGRAMIRVLGTYDPNHPVALRWQDEYRRRAEDQLASARRAIGAGRFPEAHRFLDFACEISPDLPDIRSDAEELHRLYPSVRIGVTRSARAFVRHGADERNRDEIARDRFGNDLVSGLLLTEAIRVRRLVDRPLFEPIGFEVDGGSFASAFGHVTRQNDGKELHVQLGGERTGADRRSQRFSPVCVAESLLRISDPRKNASAELWSGALDHIAPDRATPASPDRFCLVRLRPHALPESFFRVPLGILNEETQTDDAQTFPEQSVPDVSETAARNTGFLNAPYTFYREDSEKRQVSFRLNEHYVLPFGSGPKLIHELELSDTHEGIRRLAERDVVAIDRLAPWEIPPSLKIPEEYRIGYYAHPTIHFLVPNHNRPLPGSRTFRRGLLYGLNREAILRNLAPNHATDVAHLSGPIPRGVSGTASLGYGYDLSVAPRIYDAKLAVALLLTSITQARDKGLLKEEERPDVPRAVQIASDMPELILAYPENTASELAAGQIVRSWELIGVPVRLVPYSQADSIGRGTTVDFWYVPCQITEPMFDVRAILSGNGLVGASSVFMEAALEKLGRAETWPEISAALQGVHRLCHEETTVLPLWQWKDCFIVRRELAGVPDRDAPPHGVGSVSRNELLHFYQNVEHWRVPPLGAVNR